MLVTGHTGFKGAWLALWLAHMGARVTGVSDSVPTQPSLYELGALSGDIEDARADVRDFDSFSAALSSAAPEVVIHMAAQSLVRASFREPRETYDTNVMGTVNLLEAVRQTPEVRVVVNVTSDKCYANREWEWGYREDEAMGGYDPYSSSKGCAELVTEAYRRSFFSQERDVRVASARAGNVVGGGDWAQERLVPDIMRGAMTDGLVRIRNPHAVRPWQHVLNPLSGYLVLAQALWESIEYAEGWNFGPDDGDARPVAWMVDRICELWPRPLIVKSSDGSPLHEAVLLKLDSSRARLRLGWQPRWDLRQGLEAVVEWYSALDAGENMRAATLTQIEAFQAVVPAS